MIIETEQLNAEQSPFGTALTHAQCLQYALDRPGVLVAAPGVQTLVHLDQLLHFLAATGAEKDYSVIGSFKTDAVTGTCVYCNHCQPCPAGIDIGLVNKYYDLALAGDAIAANHYARLSVKADACLRCGHCERRCPFGAKQMERMRKIDEYLRRKAEILSHIRKRERRKFCPAFPFIRGKISAFSKETAVKRTSRQSFRLCPIDQEGWNYRPFSSILALM